MPAIDFHSRPVAGAPVVEASPRQRRSDADRIVEMMRQIRGGRGLHATVQSLASNLFDLFSCRRILLAARQHEGGQAWLWTAQIVRGAVRPRVQSAPIERSAREALFAAAPACWHAQRQPAGADEFEVVFLGSPGDSAVAAPSRLLSRTLDVLQPHRSCVAAAFEFGPEWTCRLFIVDPRVRRPRQNIIRLAQDLGAALAPALYNLYTTGRPRTGAADAERANLARALHDGVIQSLIAAEMEIHRIWRRSVAGTVASTDELRRLQELLHQEVLGLRDLMQRIKPVQVQPEELCHALSDCVARFRADTGIACTFSASVAQVSLPPALCPLVVRIVQEALSNVRKHSGAHHVLVNVHEARGQWRLMIEDDGCGFDQAVGAPSPIVIRECVRSLDGELQVCRASSGGLRLEIAFTGYSESREPVEFARDAAATARPTIRLDTAHLHHRQATRHADDALDRVQSCG